MGVIVEGIKICDGKRLCFGNFSVKDKIKVDGFEYNGDIYKIRTHHEVTKLEKNGKLCFESVPGCSVHDFKITPDKVSFCAEGFEDTQITLELEPEAEYVIYIDEANSGRMKANLSGKISFSSELEDKSHEIRIEKI